MECSDESGSYFEFLSEHDMICELAFAKGRFSEITYAKDSRCLTAIKAGYLAQEKILWRAEAFPGWQLTACCNNTI